jgi:hypothetical protein
MSLDFCIAYVVRLNGRGKGSLEYVPYCGDCLVPINECTHGKEKR